MKKLIFLFAFQIFCSSIFAQNNLSVIFQSGFSAILKTGVQPRGLPDIHYFGIVDNLSWDKKYYPSVSLGLKYEKKLSLNASKDILLETDLNLKYENYGRLFFNGLSIINNLYLSIKVKEKKFRTRLGLRNSIVLLSFNEQYVKDFFNAKKYRIGSFIFFDFKLNSQIEIGLSAYSDITTPFKDINTTGYRTLESTLRMSYSL